MQLLQVFNLSRLVVMQKRRLTILFLKVYLQALIKNQILQSVQVQLQMVQDDLKHLVKILEKQQVLHYLVVLQEQHVKRVLRLL